MRGLGEALEDHWVAVSLAFGLGMLVEAWVWWRVAQAEKRRRRKIGKLEKRLRG